MTSIIENKNRIVNTFNAIKEAIIQKGVEVSNDVSTYSSAIGQIEAGGSSGANNIYLESNNQYNVFSFQFATTNIAFVAANGSIEEALSLGSAPTSFYDYFEYDTENKVINALEDCTISIFGMGVCRLTSMTDANRYFYLNIYIDRNGIEINILSLKVNYNDYDYYDVKEKVVHIQAGDKIYGRYGYVNTGGSSASQTYMNMFRVEGRTFVKITS